MSNRLILGTAAFGSDYGIKHDGQPSIQEIERIARVAWEGGIHVIHTSWQYNLPKICEAIFSEFEWIRKDNQNPELFCLDHLSMFSPPNSKSGHSSMMAFYGKSVYDIKPESMDVLIVPVNVLDRRFLDYYKYKHGLIARSVFLQGLLLMDELPAWVHGEAETMINTFQIVCKTEGLEYYEAALGWILGLDEIDKVIVGINSAKQLEQLLAVKPLKWDYDFSIQDENILDPRRWPT